eukprot:TRINITY_DN4921_c0_g1_i1.p1 TRINITY_DN4921_c0_g1~~TRINITY_DN4921_c0_g1_i1.p1  ORF type:complete len:146 (-),score=7.73 TRINITY_DN4921_c0_g1_i1:386-823(-)
MYQSTVTDLDKAWEHITDRDGQYCASKYNPHQNPNCQQACMDDDTCGTYTLFGSGWCHFVHSECTDWQTADDSTAVSWRKIDVTATATSRTKSVQLFSAVSQMQNIPSVVVYGFAMIGVLSLSVGAKNVLTKKMDYQTVNDPTDV